MKYALLTASCALCVSLSSIAADNNSHAKTLLQNNCISCHQADVYQREHRKVNSLAALDKQVNNCNINTSAGWFPEDVHAVVQYLNSHYYKFK